MNPVDLSRLDALAGWMRASGAVRVVVDGDRVEMELGPLPAGEPEAPRVLTSEEVVAQAKRDAEAFDAVLFGVVEGRIA